MKKVQQSFEYLQCDDLQFLAPEDAALLVHARQSVIHAYAPYSKFRVAAVVKLDNGETVTGTNQENASYPVGICAERTALSAASSLHPGVGIEAIAVSYQNEQGESTVPISPCGICRQTLAEYEQRQHKPIRIILGGQTGPVWLINSALDILPFSFSGDSMK